MACIAYKHKISFCYNNKNSLGGDSVCKLNFQTAAVHNTVYHIMNNMSNANKFISA